MTDRMRDPERTRPTSIAVGGRPFRGPYNDTKYLENQPGVYAIHVLNDEEYTLVDVGEAAAVRDRVRDHERKTCWMSQTHGGLIVFSAYYTPDLPDEARVSLARLIRETTKPACGEG